MTPRTRPVVRAVAAIASAALIASSCSSGSDSSPSNQGDGGATKSLDSEDSPQTGEFDGAQPIVIPPPPAPTNAPLESDADFERIAQDLRSDDYNVRVAAVLDAYAALDIGVLVKEDDDSSARAFIPWSVLWTLTAAPQAGVRFPLGVVTQPWATLLGEENESLATLLRDDLMNNPTDPLTRLVSADLAASGDTLSDATSAANTLLSPPIVLAITMLLSTEETQVVAAQTGETIEINSGATNLRSIRSPKPRGFIEDSQCGTTTFGGWVQYVISKALGGLPTDKFPGLVQKIAKAFEVGSRAMERLSLGLGVTGAIVNLLSLMAQKSALKAVVVAEELNRTTTTQPGAEVSIEAKVSYDYQSDKQSERVTAINCIQMGLVAAGSNASIPAPGALSRSNLKLVITDGHNRWVNWSSSASDTLELVTDGNGSVTANVTGKEQRYNLPAWVPRYDHPYKVDVRVQLDEPNKSSNTKALFDAAICAKGISTAIGSGGIAAAGAVVGCVDIVVDLVKFAYWSAGVFSLDAVDHYSAFRPVPGDPRSTFTDELVCNVSVPFTLRMVSSVASDFWTDWTISPTSGSTGFVSGVVVAAGAPFADWSGTSVTFAEVAAMSGGSQVRVAGQGGQVLTPRIEGGMAMPNPLGFNGLVLAGDDDSDC